MIIDIENYLTCIICSVVFHREQSFWNVSILKHSVLFSDTDAHVFVTGAEKVMCMVSTP